MVSSEALFSLFPIPYSLFPIPYSLFPIPYSLFPISFSLDIHPRLPAFIPFQCPFSGRVADH